MKDGVKSPALSPRGSLIPSTTLQVREYFVDSLNVYVIAEWAEGAVNARCFEHLWIAHRKAEATVGFHGPQVAVQYLSMSSGMIRPNGWG